ncbi:hypothetical protein BC833DRAFT_564377 [Globomyces pollinis-pini]|nr:hypothetical protein BC833DRAFT_564377 [Globomyces pollinis-pini]
MSNQFENGLRPVQTPSYKQPHQHPYKIPTPNQKPPLPLPGPFPGPPNPPVSQTLSPSNNQNQNQPPTKIPDQPPTKIPDQPPNNDNKPANTITSIDITKTLNTSLDRTSTFASSATPSIDTRTVTVTMSVTSILPALSNYPTLVGAEGAVSTSTTTASSSTSNESDILQLAKSPLIWVIIIGAIILLILLYMCCCLRRKPREDLEDTERQSTSLAGMMNRFSRLSVNNTKVDVTQVEGNVGTVSQSGRIAKTMSIVSGVELQSYAGSIQSDHDSDNISLVSQVTGTDTAINVSEMVKTHPYLLSVYSTANLPNFASPPSPSSDVTSNTSYRVSDLSSIQGKRSTISTSHRLYSPASGDLAAPLKGRTRMLQFGKAKENRWSNNPINIRYSEDNTY